MRALNRENKMLNLGVTVRVTCQVELLWWRGHSLTFDSFLA